LEELEQLGFLEPLSPDERYSYVKRGCWRIIFIRGGRATAEARDPDSQHEQPVELIAALKMRGVTGKIAQELVETHPSGRIRTKIEVFDWLLRNEDKRVGKNPAGYLVASIRSDYRTPGDYQTQLSAPTLSGDSKQRSVDRQCLPSTQRRTRHEIQNHGAREAKLRVTWQQLSATEREAIVAMVKADNPGLDRWKNMLEPLCLAVLEARLSEASTNKIGQKLLFPDDQSKA